MGGLEAKSIRRNDTAECWRVFGIVGRALCAFYNTIKPCCMGFVIRKLSYLPVSPHRIDSYIAGTDDMGPLAPLYIHDNNRSKAGTGGT